MNTKSHSPLTDRLPEDVIAFTSDGLVQVSQFLQAAETLAQRLPDHKYVFNLFTDRYHYLLAFCAAVIAGQCTLLPPNRLEKTLQQLSRDYPDSYMLGDPDSPHNEFILSTASRKFVESDHRDIPEIPENQLCAVAFTSGSTGKPIANLKLWETLRTGSTNNAGMLLKQVDGQMNLLATVPPQHMWGFETSILLPLFADVAVSHLTPFYPQDIADALAALPQPRALISSPVHLNILLKSGVSLEAVERIYCATAPLDRNLAQQLESRFKTRLVEIFGSSETGALACRRTALEDSWQVSDLFELDAREDSVHIRGQHLPEQVFLQDLIEISGEGRFRLLGRHQDMINIAGKRAQLSDLNRRLLAIEGVVDGVIFMPEGHTEKLAALVVAPSLEPADILGRLRLEIDTVFLPRPVYMVSSLPRQETGKLAHRDMMNTFRDIVQIKHRERQGS